MKAKAAMPSGLRSTMALSILTPLCLAASIQWTNAAQMAGSGGAANIYTNNPNYNFTPGGGYPGPLGNPSNGSFGGNGALDPKPLNDPGRPGF
jgi:hypothetical protein